MRKEHPPENHRVVEIVGNIWDWQGIADVSREVCDLSFDFFGIPISLVDKELLMAVFTGGVMANHEAEVEIIGGPIIKVEDGVKLLTENGGGELVDDTWKPVAELNNTPFLTLILPPQSHSLLQLRHNYTGWDIEGVWSRLIKRASAIDGLSLEDGYSWLGKDSIVCNFDFKETLLRGRGSILVPVYRQSDLVRQKLERAQHHGI